MKWDDTIASTCRYGEIAGRIFGAGEVIWEDSECGYQGHANVLVKMPDGSYIHYEWTYGSCSGCDYWEAAGLTDDAVEAEMRREMTTLKDLATLRRYARLEDEFEEATRPMSPKPVGEGSVPGMLYNYFGGASEAFRFMQAAVERLTGGAE